MDKIQLRHGSGLASLLAIALSLISGSESLADAPAFEQQRGERELIAQVLSKRTFEQTHPPKAFCTAFLDDLSRFRHMELVEPIVRASTYDEPKLQTFLARCGAHPLNESFQCDGRATAGVEWKGAWPERRQQLLSVCQVGYGTKAFRAYERDVSIKDGAELLLYFEAVWGPENRKTRKYFRNGGYNVFDAKQCDLMGTVGTHDPYNYFRNVPLRNVNGLLLYKGKHYVLDMYEIDGADRDPEKPHYRMAVTGVGDRIEPVCSFSTFPKRSRN